MRKLVILGIVVVMVFNCACGDNNSSKSDTGAETVAGTSKEGGQTENNIALGDLTMLTDNRFSSSYATEIGYYYISDTTNEIGDDEYLKSIIYVDYETHQEVYLCNNPNCQHDSEDCTAVITGETGLSQNYLFGDGNYLYLVSTPYDSAGTKTISIGGDDGNGMLSTQVDEAPAIYRINMDGTAREKIVEFESGTLLENTFMGDGDNIYAVTKKIDANAQENETTYSGYDRQLVSIDRDSNVTKLIELDAEAKILGCCKDSIILEYTDYGNGLKSEDLGDDCVEILNNAVCTYVIKSIINGEEKEIDNFTGTSSHSVIIQNNIIYVSDENKQLIYQEDLLTGEKKTILEGQKYYLDYLVDNTLVCDRETTDKEFMYYLVDINSGNVTESTLQTRYKTPVDIIAQSSNKLYVWYDFESITEYVAWAGVNQESISKNYYAVISKKDYLANIANYEQVKLIAMGY